MKVISKEDMLILMDVFPHMTGLTMDYFQILLERYGDDYHLIDGELVKVTENRNMMKLRNRSVNR